MVMIRMKKIIVLIKILVCIFIPIVLSNYYDYTNHNVINDSFSINYMLVIFSVSIALIAILFTVLDRYREKLNNDPIFDKIIYPLLKELSQNAIGLLVLLILLLINSCLSLDIDIPIINMRINIYEFIILFSLTMSLFVIWDITLSLKVIIETLNSVNQNDKSCEQNKWDILKSVVNKLNKESYKELLNYIETLVVKQNIKKNKKD